MFELLIALLRLFTSAKRRMGEQLQGACQLIEAECSQICENLLPAAQRLLRLSWLDGELRNGCLIVSSESELRQKQYAPPNILSGSRR